MNEVVNTIVPNDYILPNVWSGMRATDEREEVICRRASNAPCSRSNKEQQQDRNRNGNGDKCMDIGGGGNINAPVHHW